MGLDIRYEVSMWRHPRYVMAGLNPLAVPTSSAPPRRTRSMIFGSDE